MALRDLRHRTVPAGLLGLVLFLAGCSSGPATGQLTGKVLFDGKPVSAGSVKCVDALGKVHNMAISPEGKYRLPRVAVGLARFAVETHTRVPEGMRTPTEAEKPIALPERYSNPDTSGLQVEVRRGETPYDITMAP
jgi:hypothetical protein